jgi:hypothetical protein
MPDHPIIRWETHGGPTLAADKNSCATDRRYAETQPENDVDGGRIEDSNAGNWARGARADGLEAQE